MTHQELIDVLDECDDFLDQYVDVNDGEDGRPIPNRAMSLQARVRAASATVARQQDRLHNEH